MYMRYSDNSSYSPNKRISLRKPYKNPTSKQTGPGIKFNPVIHEKIKPGIFSYLKINSLEIPNNLNKSNLVDNRQFYSRKIENKDSQEKEKSQSRNVNVSLKETSASFLNSFLIQTKKSKRKAIMSEVSPVTLIKYNPSNLFDTSASKLFLNHLHELDSSRFKPKNSLSKFTHLNEQELENRRMTIELVKNILKSNKLYNNFPLAVLKDMKIDESLIIPSNTSKTSQNKESNIRRQSLSIPFHTSNNEETSPQKMNYLYFLIQPKIVQLSQGKNSPFECYIFKLIPTSHLFNYKVDYYIIELEKMRDSNEIITLNITEILYCSKKTENSFSVGLEKKEGKEMKEFVIKVDSEEESLQYVTAINYISQLIKCKVYSLAREVK